MSIITDIVQVEEGQDVAQTLYNRLQHAKRLTGSGIFAMGGVLSKIKNEGLWKPYAACWADFCVAEAHSYAFAQTAIRIYEKYVIELQLPEDKIEALAARDYTALDKACKVVSKKNADEWFGKLLTSKRDEIIDLVKKEKGQAQIGRTPVDKLVWKFKKLTLDERAEFLRRIAEL